MDNLVVGVTDNEGQGWLNSTVWGTSLTSFLSDFGHEAVTVLLPSFLATLGAPVYALGLIEGLSDGLSSFAVGILWSAIGFWAGFAFAAIVGAAGTIALFMTNHHEEKAKIID